MPSSSCQSWGDRVDGTEHGGAGQKEAEIGRHFDDLFGSNYSGYTKQKLVSLPLPFGFPNLWFDHGVDGVPICFLAAS